jgi:hypothetical protein
MMDQETNRRLPAVEFERLAAASDRLGDGRGDAK